MSPSETKRSKRRKNKRGRVMQKPVGESSGNEFNPACIDTDTSAIQSTVLEEMQRLMDEENAEDGAAQNASFSSDLYLGGERCLLCQCERLRMEDDGSNDGVSGEIESDDKNASSAQDNLSIGSEAASLPGELESSVENPDTAAVCQCDTCNEQRLIEAEQTREMEELRSCWTELKMALHKIYRDTGLSLGEAAGGHQILTNTGGPLPPTDHLKRLVFRLCSYNQHKLYQCLEAHVRLFVVEMRLRLLHQLALGPQVGKSFVRAMLEEYAKLCLASKQMAPLLQELEAKHLRRFNLTWELVNRRLFQCIVYCDPILHTGLPELSPARLNSPNKDKCHHETYSALTKFDDEMTVIAVVWREAQQLIDDYDQEQAAARTVRTKKRTALKEWEMFNSHWQLLEDELTKKGNFQFVRQCSYNECTASQHLNSTHLASNLLTPMELASLAEQASGTACSHLAYSSHNGKVPAHMNAHHQENACNTLSGSSVPSHCENQGQMMHCVDQEACHSMVASHLDDAPPPLLKMSKVCDGSIAEDGDRTAEDSGGSKCPSASPENSFTATNGSLQQCCGGCSESQCCHKSFSSSSPPPSKRVSTISHAAASNKPTFFPNPSLTSQVSGGCAELSNQHELHGGEPHEDFWKDIILEKCISDGQSCECHACTQLKDQLVLASGSISHIPSSLPVFPSVNDVRSSPCTSKPLVHTHLYKGVTSVLASKTVPQWPLNLELEAQAVYREQIALATYGDWDFVPDDMRSLLSHQKYSGCLGNDVVFTTHPPPHSHLLNGSIHGVHLGSREDVGCMTLSSPVSVPASSAESGTLDRQSLLNYATQKFLSSDETSSSSRTVGESSEKHMSPGKKFHHGANPLCANHMHSGGCTDCFPITNTVQHVPQTTVAVKQVTVSKDHSLVTSSASSTTPVTVTNSATQCAVPNYKLIPNANSAYCGDPDCEGHSQEGEESVDDSCSEQSSSTTASNQRESRVCDCCYCEVFGHGMPAMAPVSRNYPEMRERLRLRLSKRKAEGMIAARKQNQEKSEQMVDERALEELLNFINGTEHAQESSKNSSSSSKAAKRHRKKLKKAEEKAVSEQCNAKDLQSSQLQQQQEQERRPCQKKEDETETEAMRKLIEKCKESPENSPKSLSSEHRNEGSSQKHHSNSTNNRTENASSPTLPVLNGKSSDHSSTTSPTTTTINPNSSSISSSNNSTSAKHNGNATPKSVPKQVERNPSPDEYPSKKSTATLPTKQSKVAPKSGKSASPVKGVQRNNCNSLADGQKSSNNNLVHRKDNNCTYSVLSSCVKTAAVNNLSTTKLREQPEKSSSVEQELKQPVVESISNVSSAPVPSKKGSAEVKATQQSDSVQAIKATTKSKRGKKKKNNVDDITSPDDVFMPKDIDLEDGELDEAEKELEAFKRFCFNSVPLANKEKVHVNLKDIVIKRKPAFGNSGGQYYSQRP